jgi:hypothetical protein
VFWLNLTATTHVAADLGSIVDSLVASYNTNFFAHLSSECTLTQSKASWLYASNAVVEYTGAYSDVGGGAATNATDAPAALINWGISDFYRGGHPRTYLPGVPSAQVQNANFVSTTLLSQLNTGAAAFLTAVNALTHGGISATALGTVRFASGNAWLSPPVFRAYGSGSCRSRLAIQKRRMGGR